MLRNSKQLSPGTQVIVRSNEFTSDMWTGELIGYQETLSGRLIPLVNDDTGSSFLCSDIVVEFEEELYDDLLAMSNEKQWEYLSERY